MNYEMLNIAIDFSEYINELNFNQFSKAEVHEGIQSMYEAMESFKDNGDDSINQWVETATDTLENCGDNEDGVVVAFLDWYDDIKGQKYPFFILQASNYLNNQR